MVATAATVRTSASATVPTSLVMRIILREKNSLRLPEPACDADPLIDTTFDVRDVRQMLAQTPAVLHDLTAHASADALAFREAPGAWNVLEVLCHVTDGEITNWMPRVRTILSSSGDRRFTPFAREGGFARYRGCSTAAVLAEFERLRALNLRELADMRLTPERLRLEGVHPEFGPVTLQQLLA